MLFRSIVKLTTNFEFVGLNEPATIWCKKALKFFENNKRKDGSEMVSKVGYDINKEVKKLEEIYLNY